MFDPNVTASEQVTTLAEGQTYLDTLVGEDKKFKTVEDLARGKFESDNRFIPQITKENDSLRRRVQELETQAQERIALEDFMEEVRKTTLRSDDPVEPTTSSQTNNSSPISQAEIDARIAAQLKYQREREQAQANVSIIAQELTKHWGPGFQQKLIVKAQELGLSQEFLAGVAEKSPKAFLNIVLDKTNTEAPRNDPNSAVPPRTQMTVTPKDESIRNQSYYEKLKKTDPKFYNSEQRRVQMHKDAQRLGEAFFN